eukprot:CAMPEP_0113972384 /NCGR_PEP_ID=MMETSP0011_2-20120614/13393_1 /TAXON_ID=101924 /ORGANISM="Rhodosorus marinus" /LENGTH=34 /DNA_ID=CAMNT_0000989247 /DNA_START=308 /DNA_END=412 /DNA_ORIENTATION=+ /assembly_acc=CAM_ASM_000156
MAEGEWRLRVLEVTNEELPRANIKRPFKDGNQLL